MPGLRILSLTKWSHIYINLVLLSYLGVRDDAKYLTEIDLSRRTHE
jgi:hypothetical protein